MRITPRSLLVVATWLAGCGSQIAEGDNGDALNNQAASTDEQTSAVMGDWISGARSSATDPSLTPATTTPAYVFPQGVYDNGPLIRAPHVLPILFAGDEAKEEIVSALRALSNNDYWTQAGAEYGIGALKVEAPLVLPAPSTSVSTKNVGTLVTGALSARGIPLTDNTLYAIYYPRGTTVHRSSDGATGCQDFAAFHSQFSVSANGATKSYGYAVMPRCGSSFSLNDMMVSSTHELFEWATDPLPASNKPGAASYRRLDDAHYAFQLFAGGGELTDFCPGLASNSELLTPDGLDFTVARHLSNTASAAGKFPCGPGTPQPFLVAIPQPTATDTFKHGRAFSVPVVEVPAGANEASSTVFVHSDTALPSSECWELDVLPYGVVSETSTSTNPANVYSYADTTKAVGIDITLDKTCVRAGEAIPLHVHRTKAVSKDTRVVMRMRTSHGPTWNSWPFLVTIRN